MAEVTDTAGSGDATPAAMEYEQSYENTAEAQPNDDLVLLEDGRTIEIQDGGDGCVELTDGNDAFGVMSTPPAMDGEPSEADEQERVFADEPKSSGGKRRKMFALYVLLAMGLIVGVITYSVRRNGGSSSSSARSEVAGAIGGETSSSNNSTDNQNSTTSPPSVTPDSGVDDGGNTTATTDLPTSVVTAVNTTSPTAMPSDAPTQAPTDACVSAITIDVPCLVNPTVISAAFTNCEPLTNDWLGIYPAPTTPLAAMGDDYDAWIWSCGSQDCDDASSGSQFNLEVPALPNGDYQLFLLRNTDTGDAPFPLIAASSVFQINDAECDLLRTQT